MTFPANSIDVFLARVQTTPARETVMKGSGGANLVPRVLFVWPRAEENPGKGCENNPQFVDYFVTWYVRAGGSVLPLVKCCFSVLMEL
jgi:hypothetical protein